MERRSLAEYLDRFLQLGRETAYVQRRGYRTVRWSYRQVAETAFRFARELDARAIVKGDRVLIWGPNSAEWVATFLGCALRGVVVVPMDDVATADFALRVHQQVGAKLLVCSREHKKQSLATLALEGLRDSLAPYSSAVSLRRPRTRRHARDCLHLRNDRRAEGSCHQPRQCSREHRAA